MRWAGYGGLKCGDLAIKGSLEETDELDDIGDSTRTRTKYKIHQMINLSIKRSSWYEVFGLEFEILTKEKQ